MMWAVLMLAVLVVGMDGQLLQFDKKASDRLMEGKHALEMLSRNAHTTPCWGNAIENLVHSCRQMEADDITKSRFAVHLTNCHLAKSGKDTYRCTSSMSIADCTSSMDPVAFSSYTNFYVSSENICYYLQMEHFQNLTEEKITHLYASVTDSITFLQNLQSSTNLMHDSMEESLDIQKKLATSMDYLHLNLDKTRVSVDDLNVKSEKIQTHVDYTLENQEKLSVSQLLLMEEQQKSAGETQRLMSELFFTAEDISTQSNKALSYQQQLLNLQSQAVDGIMSLGQLADVTISKQRELLEGQQTLEREHQKAHEFYRAILLGLEKLAALQQILMVEFLDIHALIFYVGCSVLAFFITTTSQTHAARFWLFLSLPAFFGMELILRARKWDTIDTFYPVNEQIWLLRSRVFPAWALLVVLRSIWVYTDQTKLLLANHSMLQEVMHNQESMMEMMKNILKQQPVHPASDEEEDEGEEDGERKGGSSARTRRLLTPFSTPKKSPMPPAKERSGHVIEVRNN